MIALVKDVRKIGLQINFQNHVLSVNQNIGINQEREINKMVKEILIMMLVYLLLIFSIFLIVIGINFLSSSTTLGGIIFSLGIIGAAFSGDLMNL